MRVKISKGKASGIVSAPPSKSYSHRYLIAAGLTSDNVKISNIVLSDDVKATISCLKTLGKKVIFEKGNNNTGTIYLSQDKEILDDVLEFDCHESGSTLRFFIPIAITTKKRLIFRGTKKLISRGIGVYQDIFDKQLIEYKIGEDYIEIYGTLKSDTFNVVGNISSQFISGLLFALPMLDGDSIISISEGIESKEYIDMTLSTLKESKINIECIDNGFKVKGNQKYAFSDSFVEGDYSNASFFSALNYFNDNRIMITNLNEKSLQGDKVYQELFNVLNDNNCTIDIKNCIDLGPILFAFASLKHGGHFINTRRLMIKESNRVLDMKKELEKFGIIVNVLDNEVFIDNSNLRAPSEVLYGHNDHRIVMALSVMATIFGGTIDNAEAINKSYPEFFNDLEHLGIKVDYE